MTADLSPPLDLAREGANGDADREIVLMRLLDAPRVLAWRAWTEPQQFAQWWGPKGFTNTIEEMDVRSDGLLRFGMHDLKGVNHPNRVTYREVVPFERLVYSHTRDQDDEFTPFQATVTFDDQDEKTRLSL